MTDPRFARKVFAAFAADAAVPALTLRGGDALGEGREPPPFDPGLDDISDPYLERHARGLFHLDAASWRHHLPHLIDYSLRHVQQGGAVIDALLASLCPPDSEPPRLASLTPAQEAVVTQFLDILAFGDPDTCRPMACRALESWWIPGALRAEGAE